LGAEKITLTGALHFDHGIGKWSSINDILEMADTGDAYTLTSGAGEVLGDYFIRKFDLGQDLFFADGLARRGDFTLELERAA
jgi:hypothetical protein